MVTLGKQLREVPTFGGIDATNDRILLVAFEDHTAYQAAIDFSRPIVIGRKGSGKSAVFKKITTDNKSGTASDGFTFADYPWDHHGKQKQSGVPDEECYRESWKYFILLMLCRLLLKKRNLLSIDPIAQIALTDIERFVKDSYGSTEPSLTQVFTPGRQIRLSGKISFGGAGGEAKTIDIEHLPKFFFRDKQEYTRNSLTKHAFGTAFLYLF